MQINMFNKSCPVLVFFLLIVNFYLIDLEWNMCWFCVCVCVHTLCTQVISHPIGLQPDPFY